MKQERDIVPPDIEIAAVDVGDVRQRVQVLDLRAIRVVHHSTIVPIRDTEDLIQGLALCVVDDRVVELLPADYIDNLMVHERLLGLDANVWANEGNLDVGIAVLDRFGE